VGEFSDSIRIDKNRLDDELIDQPMKFFTICDGLATLISCRDKAKEEIKDIEAQQYFTAKGHAETNGIKTTEGWIRSFVQVSKERQEAFQIYIRYAEQVKVLEGLKEAFMQRSYMIKDLVTMHVQDYHMPDKHEQVSRLRKRQTL
jgi:hypothetical protein